MLKFFSANALHRDAVNSGSVCVPRFSTPLLAEHGDRGVSSEGLRLSFDGA